MGYFETFRCNTNGAKHPRNVTSYVGLPRNVSERPGLEKSKNVPKIAKVEGHNTCFRTFPGSDSELYRMPPRDMVGHWKRVMWLGTKMWMPLRLFRGNLGFTRNEQIGC